MALTITLMTYRTAKTLGDLMGAYRAIQALCKGLTVPITVNFIITGETAELQGLTNPDGSFIVAAPNEMVNWQVHLFNSEKASQEFGLSVKVKGFLLHAALQTLMLLNNKLTQFFGVENLFRFLSEKKEKFEQALDKQYLINFLTKDKHTALRDRVLAADLMIIYNNPSFFLSMLQLYAEETGIELTQNAWFISEYNGGDFGYYQELLKEICLQPILKKLQAKIIMTGFPDNKLLDGLSFVGVFADRQEPKALTNKDRDVLKNLGHDPLKVEYIPGLFFGYVNYSIGNNGLHTQNPKINLELFAITAIRQYLAFNKKADQKNTQIDIIAPFSQEQCEKIVAHTQLANLNLRFQMIVGAKDGTLKTASLLADHSINGSDILVRLINIFPLSPSLFRRFLEISEPLTIQTGDQSFIEAILNKKTPIFYQAMSWKFKYYLNFITFMHSSQSELLRNYSTDRTKIASVSKYVGGVLDTLSSDPLRIDAGVQALADLAIDQQSFKHMADFFQILANKIIQDLNAGDKLRAFLKEKFSVLTVNDQKNDNTSASLNPQVLKLENLSDNLFHRRSLANQCHVIAPEPAIFWIRSVFANTTESFEPKTGAKKRN